MSTIPQCIFDNRLSLKTVHRVFKQLQDAVAAKHGKARRHNATPRLVKKASAALLQVEALADAHMAGDKTRMPKGPLPSETSDSSMFFLPGRTFESPTNPDLREWSEFYFDESIWFET